MSGKNGYVSLDALTAPRRPMKDVVIEGVGTVRVQALMQDEFDRAQAAARVDGEFDQGIHRRHQLAYGIVDGELGGLVVEDEEAALEKVGKIPVAIAMRLASEIWGLTYQPAKEVFEELFSTAPLAPIEAATADSTSSSASK